MTEVTISEQQLGRFGPVVDTERIEEAGRFAEDVRTQLAGRRVWNINSTAVGGGVAELLTSLLPYVRGTGIDARWLVMHAGPEFFRVTKRLHHALHGSLGDGSVLDGESRAMYDSTMRENAADFLAVIKPRDVVILHDPQTAGLAAPLMQAGALVIWRCHIGHDSTSSEVESGWAFLAPYLKNVPAFVFSREAYIPDYCDHGKSTVICPSIDAFSPKNQELEPAAVRAILVHTGILQGSPGDGRPIFTHADGSPGRVDRHADIIQLGQAPKWETPLVVQVSRWDPLKDPVGVLLGFADLVKGGAPHGAELVLAGPNVNAVADDPEGAMVFEQVVDAWRRLPHAVRGRIHLATLPMADVDENAAIVNALQRHAAVVVQKSLHEGFGLTVTEAMWKARPVVASAVGGIQDQITDGVHGLLLKNPVDRQAFGGAVRCLLENPEDARKFGEAARSRVRDEFLGLHHLMKYAQLIDRLDRGQQPRSRRGHLAAC